MSNETNVWINFAFVIVKQAIEDLEVAIRTEDKEKISELETFFNSSYYASLCDVDAEKIMDMTYKKAKYTRRENPQWETVNFLS